MCRISVNKLYFHQVQEFLIGVHKSFIMKIFQLICTSELIATSAKKFTRIETPHFFYLRIIILYCLSKWSLEPDLSLNFSILIVCLHHTINSFRIWNVFIIVQFIVNKKSDQQTCSDTQCKPANLDSLIHFLLG